MSRNIQERVLKLTVFATLLLLVAAGQTFAANFPLEITQPQENLNTNNRYYKAYPGIEYKVPVAVFGGDYPFLYELVTAPAGMTIHPSTGVITWPNPLTTGSPHQVSVRVRDSESSQDTVTWTITVTTSGFIFVDDVRGTHSGDGSINNPFKSLVDIYGGTTYPDRLNNRYVNHFLYFRGGTYDPEGYFALNPGDQHYALDWRGTIKPVVWLEYPGEQAIIDHDRVAHGAFFKIQDGAPDNLFIQGIKFQDMLNHALRIQSETDNGVIFECEFENLGPGRDGDNSSFVETGRGFGVFSNNFTIKSCRFNDLNIGAFLKFYSINKAVIEDNIFTLGTGNPMEGIALKESCKNTVIRNNRFAGIDDNVIGGNMNLDTFNVEICYNRVLDAGTRAMRINQNAVAGPTYIYRNTLVGRVEVDSVDSSDGPFSFYNNIIINNDSGDHLYYVYVTDRSRILVNDNLTGSPAQNIVDANGDLTPNYLTYK